MALLFLTFLLLGVGAAVLLSALNTSSIRLEHERKTERALQLAKEALIAYAVSVDLTGSKRLGDLPCPDLDNDGKKETSCGNASGSTGQSSRLGRLPWKDLGLPDLRDDSGERLWYAVSNNFKENTRHSPLNSDTTGTMQVSDGAGNVTGDVIAVIIAPGPPVHRLGASAIQDRSPANENDPKQYLDIATGEDNAEFTDGTTNGFVAGPVRNASGGEVVNDRIVVITYGDLIPTLETRVAGEVLSCLQHYAAMSQGRYPWAADISASATGNFNDVAGNRFGRLPNLMCNTGGGPSDPACTPILGSNPAMQISWTGIPDCSLTNNWFVNNWRDQVFYAIAEAYEPAPGAPSGCGPCLTVDGTTGVRVAVIVARSKLSSLPQGRVSAADRALISNYLESENTTPADNLFQNTPPTATFNDLIVYP